MAKSDPLHIRLEPELLGKFKTLARLQNRSLNNFVETVLLNYIEEFELLANPEFHRAMKEAEKSPGTPWRQAFKNV